MSVDILEAVCHRRETIENCVDQRNLLPSSLIVSLVDLDNREFIAWTVNNHESGFGQLSARPD
jgi:hypothetical protein